MTENDLQQIEKTIGISVPLFYRATLSAYPFPSGSYADQFMLPNSPKEVIEYYEADPNFSSPDIKQPFYFGSNGGEEWYFVDAGNPSSPVFVYELETGKHHQKAPTWSEFLEQIHVTLEEIAQNEVTQAERKRNRKWWQFWI